MKIAIIAVAYNRITSLNRLLTSLCSAYYPEPATLIISIDKSDTTEVEDFADTFIWNHGIKIVAKHSENLGLRRHMLSLGKYFDDFDALIVLEDDITVAQSFYYYAKQCAEKYYDDDNIAGISLYSPSVHSQERLPFTPLHSNSDVYLIQKAQSWGQVWLRKQWIDFKTWYENNNDEFNSSLGMPDSICHWPNSSWLKYHMKYCVDKNKFFINPYISLTTNNGDIGTHYSSKDNTFQSYMLYGLKTEFVLNPEIKYDIYFENIGLAKYLSLPEANLTVDFYGKKKVEHAKRYLLTCRKLNLHIVKSFALEMRPYEWNVICGIEGESLFLYDTQHNEENVIKTSRYTLASFLYNHNINPYLRILHEIKNRLHRII